METEAQILEIIRDMLTSPFETRLSIKDITSWFIDRHGTEYKRTITTKWIGTIIRKKLELRAFKTDGIYVIADTDIPKIKRLCERYGVQPPERLDEVETVAESHS